MKRQASYSDPIPSADVRDSTRGGDLAGLRLHLSLVHPQTSRYPYLVGVSALMAIHPWPDAAAAPRGLRRRTASKLDVGNDEECVFGVAAVSQLVVAYFVSGDNQLLPKRLSSLDIGHQRGAEESAVARGGEERPSAAGSTSIATIATTSTASRRSSRVRPGMSDGTSTCRSGSMASSAAASSSDGEDRGDGASSRQQRQSRAAAVPLRWSTRRWCTPSVAGRSPRGRRSARSPRSVC